MCFVLSHNELNTLRQADMTLLDQIFSKERTLSTSLAEKAGKGVCRKCHENFYGGNDTHTYINNIYIHPYFIHTYRHTYYIYIIIYIYVWDFHGIVAIYCEL